jgi:hypothetical protein
MENEKKENLKLEPWMIDHMEKYVLEESTDDGTREMVKEIFKFARLGFKSSQLENNV